MSKKTDKFNKALDSFECDFNLITEGERTFSQLDKVLETNPRLLEDMILICELSWLLRNGKAEIHLIEEGQNGTD